MPPDSPPVQPIPDEPGKIRRVLVVSGGHGWSTVDVWRGLGAGFEELGIVATPYALHERIEGAGAWLQFASDRWYDGKKDWTDEDILYQAGLRAVIKALECACDAVVVICGLLFEPRLYFLFRNAGIPVFLFGTESPYDDDMFNAIGHLASAVSVNDRASLESATAAIQGKSPNVPVDYIPVGFHPGIHRPHRYDETPDIAAHDVVFVGNMYPSRVAMLEAVDWTGIDLGLYGVFELMDEDSPLQQYKRGGVVPNELATALHQRAKIVLNLFRCEQFRDQWRTVTKVEGAESLNPRMIEAAASGCCVISEYRPEVVERFGDAVPVFRTAEELERTVRHLLQSPEATGKIAARLPALVQDLSYTEVARKIVGRLEERTP